MTSYDFMKNIACPPDRETIEREIHALFTNGDLSDVARLLQKDQSLVSKQFNPYSEEKHSPISQFIFYLWAFDAIRDDLASAVLNIVLRERSVWLPETVSPADQPDLECHIIEEQADVQKWLASFDIATASDKDLNTFDAECDEAITALMKARASARARRRVVQMRKGA